MKVGGMRNSASVVPTLMDGALRTSPVQFRTMERRVERRVESRVERRVVLSKRSPPWFCDSVLSLYECSSLYLFFSSLLFLASFRVDRDSNSRCFCSLIIQDHDHMVLGRIVHPIVSGTGSIWCQHASYSSDCCNSQKQRSLEFDFEQGC